MFFFVLIVCWSVIRYFSTITSGENETAAYGSHYVQNIKRTCSGLTLSRHRTPNRRGVGGGGREREREREPINRQCSVCSDPRRPACS